MEKRGTPTLGQYNEILEAVIKALPRALEGKDPKEVIKSFQNKGEALEKALGESIQNFLKKPIFARDMTKKGWELVEDVSEPAKIVIANMETVSFLIGSEPSISGKLMRQRAVDLGANLGQRQAEFLLEHQEEIPKEFQKFYLVFPGTVWRGARGLFFVPCLGWIGGRWILDFLWLEGGWGGSGRLLRPRK